jgi:aryl-alcohol dehydrogenase-like predicted oxidoreductase
MGTVVMQASMSVDGFIATIPLIGASSAAQLDENPAAVDLELTPAQRATLETAR